MMSPVDENYTRPNDELSPIQRQINQTTNDSLEATRNMVQLVGESHDVGIKTLVMLDEQGEKLNRIEDGMGVIHHEMAKAEQNLTELNKCCGLCVLPWRRARRPYQKFKDTNTSGSNDISSSATTTEPKVRAKNDQETKSKYITNITNDDRETEMEKNLEVVEDFVGQLKNIATDMNSKVKHQIGQIDNITNKVDFQNKRVTSANRETQDLLRRT